MLSQKGQLPQSVSRLDAFLATSKIFDLRNSLALDIRRTRDKTRFKDRKCIWNIVQPRLPQSIYSCIKMLLTSKLHLVQNRPRELVRGAHSSHIAGAYLSVEKSVKEI